METTAADATPWLWPKAPQETETRDLVPSDSAKKMAFCSVDTMIMGQATPALWNKAKGNAVVAALASVQELSMLPPTAPLVGERVVCQVPPRCGVLGAAPTYPDEELDRRDPGTTSRVDQVAVGWEVESASLPGDAFSAGCAAPSTLKETRRATAEADPGCPQGDSSPAELRLLSMICDAGEQGSPRPHQTDPTLPRRRWGEIGCGN